MCEFYFLCFLLMVFSFGLPPLILDIDSHRWVTFKDIVSQLSETKYKLFCGDVHL